MFVYIYKMNILKNLPFDLQEKIYDEYLEKQRKYHIDRYENEKENNTNYYKLITSFNSMIGCILHNTYHYNFLVDNDTIKNSIKNGKLLPYNFKELLEEVKEYENYMLEEINIYHDTDYSVEDNLIF
jgi:hypothetical protein